MNCIRSLFLLLATCCLFACQSPSSETTTTEAGTTPVLATKQSVSPPLPAVHVPFQTFSIQADQTETLQLAQGTQIEVPAGALVDAEGKPVSGKVDLQYREFHDVADVWLSGIPMTYESEQGPEVFQTAGMMEIRASQNGAPVFIAEGKSLEIEMASFVPDEAEMENGYGLYYFEESSGAWEYLAPSQAQSNTRRDITQTEQPPLPARPLKPQQPGANDLVFNFATNYSHFPELAPYEGISWQYADMQVAGTLNPKEEKWMFTEVWTDAEVSPVEGQEGVYRLRLSNKKKLAELLVKPVLEGKKYEAAMEVFAELKRKYEAVRELRRVEEERQAAQAELVRSFSISQFGIYNCDRYYRQMQAQQVLADFQFESDIRDNQFVQINQVYLIVPDANAVITYRRGTGWNSWSEFQFDPDERNYVVAMLPGNEIALFSDEDFRQNHITQSYIFDMKATGLKIASAQDLREALSL